MVLHEKSKLDFHWWRLVEAGYIFNGRFENEQLLKTNPTVAHQKLCNQQIPERRDLLARYLIFGVDYGDN